MKNLKKVFILSLCFFITNLMFSQGPLKEMVGMKASYLDSDMQQRGYEHIKTNKSSYVSYSYWWNNSKSKCVSVSTQNGKVTSAIKVQNSNCRQYNTAHNYDVSEADRNSHHSHYGAARHEAAYEKGYNDSKYQRGYHNFYTGQEKQAYAEGYSKSKEERHRNTYNNSYNGHNSQVIYKDLKGWYAPSAHDILHQRGFREIKRYQKNYLWIVWEHNTTRKCIKTGEKNGDIQDIQESEKCFE